MIFLTEKSAFVTQDFTSVKWAPNPNWATNSTWKLSVSTKVLKSCLNKNQPHSLLNLFIHIYKKIFCLLTFSVNDMESKSTLNLSKLKCSLILFCFCCTGWGDTKCTLGRKYVTFETKTLEIILSTILKPLSFSEWLLTYSSQKLWIH